MDGLGRLCNVILVSLAELVIVIACSDVFVQADSYSCWIFLLLLIVFCLVYCDDGWLCIIALLIHNYECMFGVSQLQLANVISKLSLRKGKKCAAEITIVDNQVMTGSLWHETSPFLRIVETLFIPSFFILANSQELNIFAHTRSARIRQLPTKQLQKMGSPAARKLLSCHDVEL